MPRPIGSLLLLAPLLPALGCAVTAKETPTPAARLDERELAALPPTPGERYYLLLFGSEDALRRPAFTHSWATLVRAVELPGHEPALDVHTISWLPATLDIRPLRFRVEPGVNLELHETIEYVLGTGQKVAMWGPYEVSPGLACRFLTQEGFLDGGAVGYQCVDTVGEAGRTGAGCNCIHAIADMDPEFRRGRYPLVFYGKPATANIVRRLMRSSVTIDAPRTHDWLLPRLGLCEYPIERRAYRGRVVPYVPSTPGL